MALTDGDLIDHARAIGLYLGTNPTRRLRYLTEMGILPAKFALRDRERETIAWRWPDYARRCLEVLHAYASYPIAEVAKIIGPLKAQWAAEEDALHPTSEAGASFSELGAVFLTLERAGGLERLLTACDRAGMDRRTASAVLDRVGRGRRMNARQLSDLLFVLRRAWRLLPSPRDQALILEVADHLDRQLRTE